MVKIPFGLKLPHISKRYVATFAAGASSVALLWAASAVAFSGYNGDQLSYKGQVGNAEVELYSSSDPSKHNTLRVTADKVTWVYVDRNKDGDVDRAERREREAGLEWGNLDSLTDVAFWALQRGKLAGPSENVSSFDSLDPKLGLAGTGVLAQASENYRLFRDAVQLKFKSELQYQSQR